MGRLRYMRNARNGVRGSVIEGNILQQAVSNMDLDLYDSSTTALYDVGTRLVTGDGRVFRYCKSGGECYTGQGAHFCNAIPATGIDYSALAAAASVGDMSVVMTNQGTVTQTLNGLKGGTILLKPTSTSTNAVLQQRTIIGNTAGGVSDKITISLDGPVSAALTTSSYAFCMPSPYNNIKLDGTYASSVAGLPAVYISSSGYYFWIQTWGLCWIAPQSDLGTADSARQCVFRHDGSIGAHDYSVALQGTQQHAGFVVDNNAAANGSTVIMLQISP